MMKGKDLLMILRSDFRGELHEEKGESRNSRVVNKPKIGVTLRLNWYRLAQFWWIDKSMSYFSHAF